MEGRGKDGVRGGGRGGREGGANFPSVQRDGGGREGWNHNMVGRKCAEGSRRAGRQKV